jgi:hypothetical protein
MEATMRHIIRALSIATLLASPAVVTAAAPDARTSPPWLMQADNFMMVTFKVKADAVRKVVPKGIDVLVDADGLVTATLEMYQTRRTSGIPGYATAFLVVDVKGYDSRQGAPGHFAVWGRVGPAEALDAFRGHFGFPYEQADITLSQEKGAHVSVVRASGKDVLAVRIEPNAEQPISVQGSVNMVAIDQDRVLHSEVPYISNGNAGGGGAVDVRSDDPALALIKGVKPAWSMVAKDQTFSYSRPATRD